MRRVCPTALLVAGLALGSAAPSAVGAAAEKACAVRQACSHHGTTYRVSSVTTARTLGSGFMKQRSAGVFVIVRATLTDTKSSPSTILAANLRLRARNGDSYDVSSKALGITDALVLTQELQPKLPQNVLLVYEIPPQAARGAYLEINDLFSGDKLNIRLGI